MEGDAVALAVGEVGQDRDQTAGVVDLAERSAAGPVENGGVLVRRRDLTW